MKKIVIVVGTRPAAIKLAPVYLALKEQQIPTILCATFQHGELLQQVFDVFGIKPDISLNVMRPNQDLFYLTQIILEKLGQVLQDIKPDLVLVHGDTITAFVAALTAFYLKIPVAHIEAGLRTGNKYSPYPEEVFRKNISNIAEYHFAPTALNVGNLLAEGFVRESVFCTGSTVVDALYWVQEKIKTGAIVLDGIIEEKVRACKLNKQKIVLLTAHRRESFDGGILRILNSVKKFAQAHEDVFVFYPAHPNPYVQKAIEESGIRNIPNIYVGAPLIYTDLVYLMTSADWIMTDSGGIQEEAVSIGKKVLVLRDVTERAEGLWDGLGILVGTNEQKILFEMKKLYETQSLTWNPRTIYGDGTAAIKIAVIIKEKLQLNSEAPKKKKLTTGVQRVA
ncbi:MAG: UDP-N-acetylglucosamine 2-epimerase (non-hydrolyzing) [bacterium]